MKLKKIKFLYWIPTVFWMAVIFALSSQPASESNDLSEKVTRLIINITDKIMLSDAETGTVKIIVSNINHIVRKLAHYFSYLILGLLTANAFYKNGVRNRKLLVYTMAVCILYAFGDEVHQLFVPGRSGQLKDVAIDSLGALTGYMVYTVFAGILKIRTD